MLLALVNQQTARASLADLRAALQELEADFNGVLNLLHNLLHWALAQQQALALRSQPTDLVRIVESVVALLEPMMQVKNITYRQALPPEAALMTDPNVVGFILRNLLGNAVQYTPVGGTIDLTIQQVGESYKVAVSNTGPGIDPALLTRLFQSQHLLVEAFPQAGKGTGLGLQLCKEFTALLQGEIWAANQAGRGVTFYLTIPLALPLTSLTTSG